MPKKRTFYSEEERKAHHEKKQREADLQIQELTKHWENDPKDIAEYLAFSTQFYKYSSRNTMLIYRQRPDSVFIASYTHWKELGYYVQEGEHNFAFGRDILNEPDREPWAVMYDSEFRVVTDEALFSFDEEWMTGATFRNETSDREQTASVENRLKALIQQYYGHVEAKNYTVEDNL